MDKRVILFGAGSDIEKILKMLIDRDVEPLCICDNNPGKWGTMIEDIEIVNPQRICEFDTRTIIISASFFDAIYLSICKILGGGVGEYDFYVAPFLWFMLVNVTYDKALLRRSRAFVATNEQKIRKIFNLQDKLTKEILDYILAVRKEDDYIFSPYKSCLGMQFVEGYFYHDELNDLSEFTIIDIGAYNGDTMEELFGRFQEKISAYYAYEPQEDNYRQLIDNMENKWYKDRVLSINKALGSEKKQIVFGKSKSAFGTMDTCKETEGEVLWLETLDMQDIEIKGKMVIKMDVEGLELDIIKGAVGYIKQYRPYMAICVYHRVSDIYEIPREI